MKVTLSFGRITERGVEVLSQQTLWDTAPETQTSGTTVQAQLASPQGDSNANGRPPNPSPPVPLP